MEFLVIYSDWVYKSGVLLKGRLKFVIKKFIVFLLYNLEVSY